MAAYNQTVLTPDPLYLQPKSYDARSDRKWFSSLLSAGIDGAADYAVTVPGTPAGFTLNIAAGVAYVKGGNIVDQGMYRQYIASATTVVGPAAHASLPRIDTVILRIMDTAADASGFSEPRIEVVPGTASAGATLANLTGANPLTALGEASQSFIILAYILVPAAATVFTNTATNVRDARTRSVVGSGTAVSSGVPIGASIEWNSTTLPPATDGTYLVEDGSAISRTTFATWFTRIGTIWGTGDGSTTVNIPDSRSRIPVAYTPSGGHTDHSALGAAQSDGLALAARRVRHRHTVGDPTHRHNWLSSPGGGSEVSFGLGAGSSHTYADSMAGPSTGALPGIQNVATGVTVGPQTGNEPVDMPAYINKNKLIRVA